MCDSAVATGPATASGQTLFAKNSDRHAGECQPFVQFAAADYAHGPGEKLACTHIAIDQAPRTRRVMGHSPWWVWGFEHGVNAEGLAIGNQSVFSREPVEEAPGLIGMDLVRLGLERSASAREAIEVIAGLLEAHGQGGSGFGPGEGGYHNSFSLADPEEAWLMETSGRHYAATRVESGSLSNHMSIGAMSIGPTSTGADWSRASDDLEAFARAEGWWSGDGPVDVAAAYRNANVPGFISEGRLARSAEWLREGRGRHDVRGMIALLRDHGAPGAPPPAGLAPDDIARYTLCMHAEPVGTTTASLVAELPRDRSRPWPVWVSFGSPCLGVFLPVYLEGEVPAALARGGEHPSVANEPSAWWAFHELQAGEAAHSPALPEPVRTAWAGFEAETERGRIAAEKEAAALVAAGEPRESAAVLTAFMEATAKAALGRARALAQALGAG